MKSIIKDNILSLSILLSGILISIAIIYSVSLDVLEKIFSIFGSSSIVIAVASYYYVKNQDKTGAAIDQVHFFRCDVLSNSDIINKIIIKKHPSYNPPIINIETPTMDAILEYSFAEAKQQVNVFRDDLEMHNAEINLLNSLEELSLKIIHRKTQEHQALNSIKAAFVELVEKNALVLFYQRDIISQNKSFSATLKIYFRWKNELNRTPNRERRKDFFKRIGT